MKPIFISLLLLLPQGFSQTKPWETFKKPSKESLKKTLSPLQFEVTQKDDTEKPFKNEFWNHHEEGLYVDIVSGEPLFSSQDKFDSGTGWPSFTKPLDVKIVVEKQDRSLFYSRTEVRSKYGDSHLGHVFDDGPKPTGKRYCMNSASLRFVSRNDLEKQGYGMWSKLFSTDSKAKAATFQKSVFAGGCFWCMEPPFEKLKGVKAVRSGYIGGAKTNPTYEEVSTQNTGHVEAVEVEYDPTQVSYATLVDVYWKNIDPLDSEGQFCDKGASYRSVLFYQGEEEKAVALESAKVIEKKLGKPIVTKILPNDIFYPAEENHQDYYKKNPIRYRYYRAACGRDKRLTQLAL